MNTTQLAARLFALLGSSVLLGPLEFAVAQEACQGLPQADCRGLIGRNTYVLSSNNVVSTVYGSKTLGSFRVTGIDGNLIALDFRPAEFAITSSFLGPQISGLYGLTDRGAIYRIATSVIASPTAALVGRLGTSFDGGLQSLADFNPVVDALRVIGSNDQNFAVVNNAGNLGQTVPQTAMSYAAGDPQAGVDPNLTAGAYNNNLRGAAATLFYALDYARDTMVTIADLTATGSSNTGGGKLKTIGRIVDTQGNAVNIQPSAGIDIYTDASVGNVALIANGQTLYYVNLATVNTALPVGSTQDVVVRPLPGQANFLAPVIATDGVFTDVAVTPTPVVTTPADVAIGVTALSQGLDARFFGWTRGQVLTFTVTLTNQGPDAATGVTLATLQLPFANPVVATTSGNCSTGPLNEYGKSVSCNIGTLAAGSSATVTVNVTQLADTYATGGYNTGAQVSAIFSANSGGTAPAVTNDPNSSNNSSTIPIIVNR